MAGTKATSSTSKDPWWLNPEIAWLGSREIFFLTPLVGGQEKPAQDLLRAEMAAGSIPWHAELEVEQHGDLIALWRTGSVVSSMKAIRQVLFSRRGYPDIDWRTNSSVYIGPVPRWHKDPDGSVRVVFDGRGTVRITATLIRFHHDYVVRMVRRVGLLPAVKSQPAAGQPVVRAEPPEKSSSGSAPASKSQIPTVKDWTASAAENHPRPRGVKDYAGYLMEREPLPRSWSKHSIQNALSQLARGKKSRPKRR
jgi:hypothetical protein